MSFVAQAALETRKQSSPRATVPLRVAFRSFHRDVGQALGAMELLRSWLNDTVGLSRHVTDFEGDMANGYLFGEVLCQHGLLPMPFHQPHQHVQAATDGRTRSLSSCNRS